MTEPSDALSTYITVYDIIPDKWNDEQVFNTEQLRQNTNRENVPKNECYSTVDKHKRR